MTTPAVMHEQKMPFGENLVEIFGLEPEQELPDVAHEESSDGESSMREPFDPAKIQIVSKTDSLHNLIQRLEHNEIDMNTDFQRHGDLWDTSKMSRLIESILIRFPLPAFYFDATNDDRWLVVDGLQRLSAIRKFVVEKDARKQLVLRDLEYLKDLEGKKFSELSRNYLRRLQECPVTLFLIQPGTPEAVKYSIFRRINTGGIVLNDQEIRNAMAKPAVREFLQELADNEDLRGTLGDQSKRMVDQELVVRFLAFRYLDYQHNKKNIATFLDDMMGVLGQASTVQLQEYKTTFSRALKRCNALWGRSAFEKRQSGQDDRGRRKNGALFEVWTVALSKLTDTEFNCLLAKRDDLIERHTQMMTSDEAYFRAITYSTQKKDHVSIRHNRVKQLIEEYVHA